MSVVERTAAFLLDESSDQNGRPHPHHGHGNLRRMRQHLEHLEPSAQLQLIQQLLCVRHPEPCLPEDVLADIDLILQRQQSCKLLTQAVSIPPQATLPREGKTNISLCLWQGDITTLSGATAITNAANSLGLGCFQPTHRCIDNVIHTRAGPRLRDECYQIMGSRGRQLDVGEAIVTRGYSLPSPFVIHTVGPQLNRGTSPTDEERKQLAKCYQSVLGAVEPIPVDETGRKLVVLCGISTGLFAFPAREAALIAVETVLEWIQRQPDTTITDVIFNTFTDADQAIYKELLVTPPEPWLRNTSSDLAPLSVKCDAFTVARQWLRSADYVLVSAGAGLSAATGLDYTSPTLFEKHFSGFLKYGLTTLYSVFGFSSWPSEQDRWGYYFTHMAMARSWPQSSLYDRLLRWLERFGENAHVRTSNADGFFLKHGWPEVKLSTPQGRYSVLQCLANCTPDSTVPSAPLLVAALPALDPVTQRLNDPSKVPRCQFCGGKMNICVRAASWFNEEPFQDGETRWKAFRNRALQEGNNVVILELGAGMSTPGVLRWPNEDLVTKGQGKVKLVRVCLGSDATVPWDLEQDGTAIGIDGDISTVVEELCTV